MTPDVKQVFEEMEPSERAVLLKARALIFDCAAEIPVEECLKWGQPSYLAPKGSTLRLGVNKAGLSKFDCV